jgi:hypothetical protein
MAIFLGGTGSDCNSAARTFDGVDVMGRRLAEEVSADELTLKEYYLAKLIKNKHSIIYLILPFSFAMNSFLEYQQQHLLLFAYVSLN